jgi:hypothetical protein
MGIHSGIGSEILSKHENVSLDQPHKLTYEVLIWSGASNVV